MKKIINEIKDNYKHYEDLIKKNKKILNTPIIVEEKNPFWEIGTTELIHLVFDEKLKMSVQQCKRETKYNIQLFCASFTNVAIFRFDSAGPRHKNRGIGGILLNVVDTPHFHHFTESGREIAYQTDILKDPKECDAIIQDIDFGISHFCNESNSFLNEHKDVPTIGKIQAELKFDNADGVNYDNIKFDDEN